LPFSGEMNAEIPGENPPPQPRADTSVRELAAMRPRLRRSLRFTFQEYGGVRCCVIEDPLTSAFHRVGLPEYLFITYLDGKRTFAEAYARASLAGGAEALTEREAVALISWLTERGLADFGSTPAALLEEHHGEQRRRGLRTVLNFLFLRLPLGSPDRLLDRLDQALGWIWHPAGAMVWAAAIAAGLLQVAWNWNRFARMSEGVLAGSNAFWLAAIWVMLKGVHETGHGLASKHYGCRVREAGLYFILFFPVTYIDATASWGLPSKWRRMLIAAAGMGSELFVAALAALYWSLTEPGLANTLAYNTMLMAGVSTLLFNANPLMRFDGYYLLCDLVEIPNLYAKSQALVTRLAEQWLLAAPADPLEARGREFWVLTLYGTAALFWRGVVMLSLLFAATALFKGGGLIFALVALGAWVGPALRGVIAFVNVGWRSGRFSRSAGLPRLALLVGAALGLAFLPVHSRIGAPALLQCADQTVLRAECPGFINRIYVKNGEAVHAGEDLVEMRNLEVETELKKLAIEIESQDVKSRLELAGGDVAAYQGEADSLEGLRKQYAEAEQRVGSLNVRAPVDGTVVEWGLEQRVGTFLQPGDRILEVGAFPANEVKIAVPEADIEFYRRQVGHSISVLIDRRGVSRHAVLERITARSSRDLTLPALSVAGGGPLPVVRRREDSTRPNGNGENQPAYELLDPVFEATARLDPAGLPDLRSGELARIKFHARQGVPLWRRGYTLMDRLVAGLLGKATRTAAANSIL